MRPIRLRRVLWKRALIEEEPDDPLHPGRKCFQPALKILANRRTMMRVVENGSKPEHDTLLITGKHILEPVQRLDDAHRRTISPIELARCRELEFDREVAERDGASARICVDNDMRRDSVCKAKIVSAAKTSR